ncbi:MAG TPA: septum formation initiator family protein [Candidatus Saccharimonadales bacterium]|nr:septum formation initiator family protein [Candidatus Saccharimonadales bacterium]
MRTEQTVTWQKYVLVARSYVLRLGDVRFAGQIVFVIIVLLVSWSGIKAIDANYSLQKQITALQQQNTVQELENNNLKLQNEYYDSDQYLELSARQNFGLAAPGETELLVPKSVAMSYTVPEPKQAAPAAAATTPAYLRNLQAWLNFFLHRPQAAD